MKPGDLVVYTNNKPGFVSDSLGFILNEDEDAADGTGYRFFNVFLSNPGHTKLICDYYLTLVK